MFTSKTCIMNQPAGRATYSQSMACYSWSIFRKISPYNLPDRPVDYDNLIPTIDCTLRPLTAPSCKSKPPPHPLSYERAPAAPVVASRPLKLGSFFLVLVVHSYGEISAADRATASARPLTQFGLTRRGRQASSRRVGRVKWET